MPRIIIEWALGAPEGLDEVIADAIVDRAMRWLDTHDPTVSVHLGYDPYNPAEETADGRRAPRRRGLPGPSDADLREVAEIYKSNRRAPNGAVMGKLGVSQRTASRWIGLANDAGLLTDDPR